MRLIDADMVISIAKGEFGKDDLSKILWLISHVPTAYKVDNVVEKIKSLSPANYVEKDKVIEIVRGGGVGDA